MYIVKSVEELSSVCQNQDWFSHIGSNDIGKHIVYVKHLNAKVYAAIPEMVNQTSVLVHFATSINNSLKVDNFIATVDLTKQVKENMLNIKPEPDFRIKDSQLVELNSELDRLEKICGAYSLQDIFFEIHDKTNAVTNLSIKFPEVRKNLEKLYKTFGFDILYKTLEG